MYSGIGFSSRTRFAIGNRPKIVRVQITLRVACEALPRLVVALSTAEVRLRTFRKSIFVCDSDPGDKRRGRECLFDAMHVPWYPIPPVTVPLRVCPDVVRACSVYHDFMA